MCFEPIVLQFDPVLFQVKGQTEQEQLLFLLQKSRAFFLWETGSDFSFICFIGRMTPLPGKPSKRPLFPLSRETRPGRPGT